MDKLYITTSNDDFVEDLREPHTKKQIQERFADLYNGCRDEDFTKPEELDFDFIQGNWEVSIKEVTSNYKLEKVIEEIGYNLCFDNFINKETMEMWKTTEVLSCKLGWTINRLSNRAKENDEELIEALIYTQEIIDCLSKMEIEGN